MKYDFRKALSKLTPKEQADRVLTKIIDTISNQKETRVPQNAILEFCLKKVTWLAYNSYIVSCSTLAWEKLDCETDEEAWQVFYEIIKLLQNDGYNVSVLSNYLFEIEL